MTHKWQTLKDICKENGLPIMVVRKSIMEKRFLIVAFNKVGCVGYDEKDEPLGIKFHDTDKQFSKVDLKTNKEKIFGSCLRKSAFSRQPIQHELKFGQISYRCNVCGKWHLTKVGAMK